MDKAAVENRGIDEGFFLNLCNIFKSIPVLRTFGVNLIYLGPGTVGMKMTAAKEHTTISRRLHGGMIATLADTAMGWAVLSQGIDSVTLDMRLNYFVPVFEGTEIIAEGCVIYAGKTTASAEASLFSNGKLIAKSQGTFVLKPDTKLEAQQ
jgi:acyl-CoA thioesterase